MLEKHQLPVAKQSDSTKLKVCVQKNSCETTQ